MSAERCDPRPARSRARLLDAATELLRSGGPGAVTVDAVLKTANVARATLYRHYPSGNDLLAAAFHALIPSAPAPPEEGSFRERLLELTYAQAELIAEAPVSLAAMSWLALGGNFEHLPWGAPDTESPEVRSLRLRMVEQYAEPFATVLGSPEAVAELGDVDPVRAFTLLLGPIVLGKLSMLPDFDHREIAGVAAAGFLATHAVSARNTGPAGA